MLTRVHIQNFKRFDDVAFDLGQAVVLIGPNNSGKTTALQALALWDVGLRQWNAKWRGSATVDGASQVTLNRRDLIAIPVPDANLLWRNLDTRDLHRTERQLQIRNSWIRVTLEGVSQDQPWICALEFGYANEESLYCRPVSVSQELPTQSPAVPTEAAAVNMAFLAPMSGLAAIEPRLEPGRLKVLVGEGQTAQVLRNLCYQIYDAEPTGAAWQELQAYMRKLFGIELLPPQYLRERGEITMAYRERGGSSLDLSSSGRGLQQTLLLLAHLYTNPGTVLLLDEPDAHLEVLRQRQIYQLLTDVARRHASQIIAASHSEVVLNEAAGRDMVIAFVGQPHRIDGRASQVLKSLLDLDFDQYYLAEQAGCVLYLEGSTDLAILRAFAETLAHPASQSLDRPFVHYMNGNQPQKARDHFYGLREAKTDLVGLALFDRPDKTLTADPPLAELMWQRREIENYLCQEDVLIAYARHNAADDLFGLAEAENRERAMRAAIADVTSALQTLGRPGPWSADIKASDDFLDPLFDNYFKKLGLPNLMRKNDYYVLASLVPADHIDPEVSQKLDAIVATARQAKPRQD